MKKAVKVCLLFIFIVISVSCMQKKMTFTVLFKQIEDLRKNSPVYLDDVMVGNVKKIKLQKNKIAVKVLIFRNYVNSIKTKSNFYILGKGDDTHIFIKVNDHKSTSLKSGSVVKGSSKTSYWLDKGKKTAKSVFDKGVKKTKEYLKSDEWKKLKTDISQKVEVAAKKGKKELDKQLPILKEKAFELYKDSPEILENVKTYFDSLSNEKEKENND